MKSEKRNTKRYRITLPAEGQLLKRDKKTPLTETINLVTKDLGLGGVRIKWPKGWICAECRRCLGWIYNERCRFKSDLDPKVNRDLNSGLIIKLKFLVDFEGEKVCLAKVVWIQSSSENQPTYDTGLSFIDIDESSVEKILIIRKS